MNAFHLTPALRRALDQLVRTGRDRRELRRALALLDLDRGESVTAVAGRYRVSRETVYQWAARLHRTDLPAGRRLRDAPRGGRPAQTRHAVEAVLRAALPTRPLAHGYRHPTWTVRLLRQHLGRRGVRASEATVRRALRGLGYRWKRPRFVLARRAAHWRQAKGGSDAG